jgi:16S rRNA G527 N7-methylase RsmG
MQVTAIDSTRKKTEFVEQISYGMGLTNFKVLSVRAEHWHAAGPFDAICLKAVGPIARCLEQCDRLAQAGTHIIMFKTASLPSEELDTAEQAAAKLDFEPLPPYCYQLPDDRNPRALHVYKKR